MKMKNVEVVGFHEHHGRHDPSTKYWEEQMKSYAREMGRVCQALGGYQPKEIDIGGGFAIPRDPFAAVVDYTEPLQYAALYSLSRILNLFGSDSRYRALGRIIKSITVKPNQKPAPTIRTITPGPAPAP